MPQVLLRSSAPIEVALNLFGNVTKDAQTLPDFSQGVFRALFVLEDNTVLVAAVVLRKCRRFIMPPVC